MDIFQAIIIGIVQGLTEFLPVSSSAHLVFTHQIMNNPPNLAFDTILHVGSLIAVVIYFWNDIIHMIKSFIYSIVDIFHGQFREGIREDQFKRLAWLVIIGTIPAGLAGVLFKDFFESLFSSIPAIGLFLIVTGFLLWGSEKVSRKIKDKHSLKEMSIKNSLIIGIFQAMAIAPGISKIWSYHICWTVFRTGERIRSTIQLFAFHYCHLRSCISPGKGYFLAYRREYYCFNCWISGSSNIWLYSY